MGRHLGGTWEEAVMAAKSTAKKAPAKKAPAKKTVAKKAPAKKAPAKKTVAKKAPAKKAPAKKTVAKKAPKTPFGKKFLDEQKKALLAERARYVQSADTLQAEADSLLEDRDPGDVQFDDESGEGDTLAVERDLDLALSAQARDAVEEIDEALDRIRRRVYGVCVKSGKNIPKERLKAIPWAAERVEFKAGGLGRR
ncbi:MAG: DNA-binding protein [Actinomycetota bacterium]|nr:DNA-binding protein [Actinomycetota bacterium]MEC8970688.1 DNA-binding protein [Actinomycetota bacterium]